jgi:cholesterol oxidase
MRLAKRAIASALGDPAALAGHAVSAAASAGGRSAAEIASQVLGYTADGADHRIMLLAMGRDAVPGRLRYDHRRNRMIAELALDELAPAYSRSERVMADVAGALGGELRTSPAWALLGKAFTTHNQGGCGMSDEPGGGVTTPDGEVHGCDGLYVADGSLLCTSVGVNPSATIAAVAERNALQFIRAFKDNPRWPAGETDAGAREYAAQQREAADWALRARTLGWSVRPPEATAAATLAAVPSAPAQPAEVAANRQPLGLAFRETMQGFYQPADRAPRSEIGFRALETAGRPEFPVRLELEVSAADLDQFRHDQRRRLAVTGSVAIRLPAEPIARSRTVRGTLELLVRPDGDRDGAERRMNYELSFTDEDVRAWTLCGYKRIRAQPWRDTSSLFVTLASPPEIRGAGVVHVDLDGLLFRQVPSLTVTAGAGDPERSDPARALWAKLEFAGSFLGRLLGSYAPELPSSLATLLDLHGGRDHRRRPGRHGRHGRHGGP